MRVMYIVNASPLLSDGVVRKTIAPLQKQIDRDFMPAWRNKVVEPNIKVDFAAAKDIPQLPSDCWPIFLNRHSNEEGALGWHDDDPRQNIRTHSRVFVGDCMQLGLNWHTTLSHEALEIILDPDIRRVFRMANGRLAAYEACDAVEADKLAYLIDGFAASDFVLPNYFTHNASGVVSGDEWHRGIRSDSQFDFRNHLKGPCPALTPGGYMSVTDANGRWKQVTMDNGGLMGRRAAMNGFRRKMRAPLGSADIEVVP